jgi:PhnB protein
MQTTEAIMSSIQLAPYIFFNGQCQEAMEFYKNIFGGELETMPYDNLPPGTPGVEGMEGKLMNASLLGGDVDLRGSDTSQASPEAKKIELCLTGSDEAHLREIFDGLADGGSVRTPLEKMFWGDTFGQLTDKYGVEWMVNISAQ